MDCNKEEATRARDIAEMKMQGKDYVGARKLLLKASNLFPDIENASHMLTVCEVHCSAANLFNGQTDHYGILQVEVSADESLIRKQYRKLALLLHPDKNKFVGAEAAFKLVGEAYKVLSDQAIRQVYDAKRRIQVRTMSTWQPSQSARNARRYTAATFNVTSNQFGGLKQQEHHHPSSAFSPSQSFWTMCVFCNTRFQYARSWLNREVQCQNCYKKFLAFELSPQNVPPPGSSSGFSWSRAGFHEAAVPPAQHSHTRVSQTHASQPLKPAAATNNGHVSKSKDERVELCEDGVAGSTQPEKEPVKMTANARRTRNRRVVKSSDSESIKSESSDSDSILEVDPTIVHGGPPTSSRYPRRSNRHRVNVTYREDESEDDFVRPRKRLRKAGSFGLKNQGNSSPEVVTNGVKMEASEAPIPSAQVGSKEVDGKKGKQVKPSSNANPPINSTSGKPQTGCSFSFPDPELYDFDKDRDQNKFAVNQIWAVYDDVDGMPRFYALIQKVHTPGFRLQYVWLESNPTSTAEKVWVKAGLPIACGNFRLGDSCWSESQEMFSHVIFCEKKSGCNKFNIYPKKGEVWALFKGWDIGWSSAAVIPKNFMYEFVEVVSSFEYGKDIIVSHLAKVDGFRYLFTRAPDKEMSVLPSGQLLKFSHRIPYYKVCEERGGIPRDSFELDPAALPESLVKMIDPVSTVEDNEHDKDTVRGGVSVKSEDLLDRSADQASKQHAASEAPLNPEFCNFHDEHEQDCSSNAEESADTEFCNFHDMRSEGEFEQGQIWALYCDIDSYPKFYAWVKKVNWERKGFIHIKWLEYAPVTNEDILWSTNGLISGCGRFKVAADHCTFRSTESFSHIVHAYALRKNLWYEIYPNPGEIWAVYKNWSLNWTSEHLRKVTDFNVVEIILRDTWVIKAVTLTKVKGYNYVFKPETNADFEVPMRECMMFSHEIPAFRLTDEEAGKLKDYWELDPESLPKSLLNVDP